MAQMQQKPVFALPDCQRMNVNTFLCDTLGLAEYVEHAINPGNAANTGRKTAKTQPKKRNMRMVSARTKNGKNGKSGRVALSGMALGDMGQYRAFFKKGGP